MAEMCRSVNAENPVADEVLVKLAKAGDESAGAELYRRWFRPMCAYASRLMDGHGDADDVAQESLLRALAVIDRYEARNGCPFRGWLCGVVKNTVRHWRRARSRAFSYDALPFVDALMADALVSAPRPDQAALLAEAERLPRGCRLRLIERAVSRLSGLEADVFELFGDGLTLPNIADRLGLDRVTAARAYTAALARVRGSVLRALRMGPARPVAPRYLPVDVRWTLRTCALIPADWPQGKRWNGLPVVRVGGGWMVAGGAR